jgi:hypothetical protein
MSSENDKPKPKGAVGYGRPPVERQFKPGRSGNAKGRPKKQERSWTTLQMWRDIMTASNEEISVTINGRVRKLSKFEVTLRNAMNLSAKGDAQMMKLVLRLMLQAGEGLRDANPDFHRKLTYTERQFLERPYGHDEFIADMIPILRRDSRKQ